MSEIVEEKTIREEALALLSAGGVPSEDYGHETYYCPNCNQLYDKFHFCILTAEKKFTPKYKCEACGRRLVKAKIIENDDNDEFVLKIRGKNMDWHCPMCKNGKMLIAGFMNWD